MSESAPYSKNGRTDSRVQTWVNVPIVHMLLVHPGRYYILAGACWAVMGLASIMTEAGNMAVADFMMNALRAICVLAAVAHVVPCRCGRRPVLCAQGRASLNRLTWPWVIAAFAISASLSYPIYMWRIMHADSVIAIGSNTIVAAASLILGVAALLLVVFRREHVLGAVKTIDIRRAPAVHSSNTTAQELEHALDFHLAMDNLGEADTISKKLVSKLLDKNE